MAYPRGRCCGRRDRMVEHTPDSATKLDGSLRSCSYQMSCERHRHSCGQRSDAHADQRTGSIAARQTISSVGDSTGWHTQAGASIFARCERLGVSRHTISPDQRCARCRDGGAGRRFAAPDVQAVPRGEDRLAFTRRLPHPWRVRRSSRSRAIECLPARRHLQSHCLPADRGNVPRPAR